MAFNLVALFNEPRRRFSFRATIVRNILLNNFRFSFRLNGFGRWKSKLIGYCTLAANLYRMCIGIQIWIQRWETKLCELPAKCSVLERPYYCLVRSNKCKFSLWFDFISPFRPLVNFWCGVSRCSKCHCQTHFDTLSQATETHSTQCGGIFELCSPLWMIQFYFILQSNNYDNNQNDVRMESFFSPYHAR